MTTELIKGKDGNNIVHVNLKHDDESVKKYNRSVVFTLKDNKKLTVNLNGLTYNYNTNNQNTTETTVHRKIINKPGNIHLKVNINNE